MRQPDFQTDDGSIRLFMADCLDVLPELEAGSVDAVVTDPPYGICLANHDSTGQYRRNRSWNIAGDGDLSIAQAVLDWAGDVPVVMFCSPDKPLPGQWRNRLVWYKRGLGMGGDPSTCWRRDWEMICVRGNGPLRGGRDSSILDFEIRPSEFEHPDALAAIAEKGAESIVRTKALDALAGRGATEEL